MPKGYIEIGIALRQDGMKKKIDDVKFGVVDIPNTYNAILGKPNLNTSGAIVSTKHLVMKFLDNKDCVVSVCIDQ